MYKIGILIFCFFCVFSCKQSNQDYWSISKFNIQPGMLKDNSKVKLLYSSERSVDNQNDCYIHLIVTSIASGDTFNILTVSDNGLKKEDSAQIFVYFDESNIVTNVDQLIGEDYTNQTYNLDSLSKVKVQRREKVVRNRGFDYLADNQFPTVIGSIGVKNTP